MWPLDTYLHQWLDRRSKIQKKCFFGTPYFPPWNLSTFGHSKVVILPLLRTKRVFSHSDLREISKHIPNRLIASFQKGRTLVQTFNFTLSAFSFRTQLVVLDGASKDAQSPSFTLLLLLHCAMILRRGYHWKLFRAVHQVKKLASALARNSGEDEGNTWRETITRLSILLVKGNAALLSGRIPSSPSAFHEAGIV